MVNQKPTMVIAEGSFASIEIVNVSPGATVFCETVMELISGPSLSLNPPSTVNVARAVELLQQLELVQFCRESLAYGVMVYVPPMTVVGTVQL
jgi:hypothetical protein